MQENKSNPSHPKFRKLVLFIFFGSILALGLVTYKDYGIGWDESPQRDIGKANVKYLGQTVAPFLLTPEVNRYENLKEIKDKDYGPPFEIFAHLTEIALNVKNEDQVYLLRHILNFLVFSAGAFGLFLIASRRYQNFWVGLLVVIFLILSPRIYADAFYNSKDIVFMATFILALNTLLIFSKKPTIKNTIAHAFFLGLAIDTRISGIILLPATILMYFWRAQSTSFYKKISFSAMLVGWAAFFTVALWPWLWHNPLSHFMQALSGMSKFRLNIDMLFNGEIIQSTNLPWYYVIEWIGITTPPFYLFLFFIGALAVSKKIISSTFALSDEEKQDMLFLALLVLPILLVILLNSTLYNGWRHLYFIYPLILLVSLKGWLTIWRSKTLLSHRSTQATLLAIFIFSFISTSYWMIKNHPMQNIYFNFLAGNNRHVRFDLDYWGLGNKILLEKILAGDSSPIIYLQPISSTPIDNSFRILEPKLRARLKMVGDFHAENNERPSPIYQINNFMKGDAPVAPKEIKGCDLVYTIKDGDELILTACKVLEN
jgi:hypothetical protein